MTVSICIRRWIRHFFFCNSETDRKENQYSNFAIFMRMQTDGYVVKVRTDFFLFSTPTQKRKNEREKTLHLYFHLKYMIKGVKTLFVHFYVYNFLFDSIGLELLRTKTNGQSSVDRMRCVCLFLRQTLFYAYMYVLADFHCYSQKQSTSLL